MPAGAGAPSAGARRKKGKRGQVDQEAVSANISRTMRQMGGPGPKRRGQRDDSGREELEAMRAEMAEREKKMVRVNEFITVSELADILKVPATQIVSFAFKNLGLMVTINQRLDFDQIELIASEFGFNAVREEEYAAAPEEEAKDLPEDLRPRPPVVTIMGHVDHGKTIAARLHPQGQRRGGRGRRHHAAHRRLSRHDRVGQERHLPRHAGPRGVHRDACPRRAR